MDYYACLKVGADASHDDIRKAYKKMALEYHPDRTNGDKDKEEKFKSITHAYSVLSDADSRRQYDIYGHDDGGGGGSGSGFSGFDFSGITVINLDDIFHDILSDLADMSPQHIQESPMQYHHVSAEPDYIDLQISLADMSRKKPRTITFDIEDRCSACVNVKRIVCMSCRGIGRVMERGSSLVLSLPNICLSCHGQGSVSTRGVCGTCNDTMKEVIKRTMDIPISVCRNLELLTFAGQGSYNPSTMKHRDLHIQLHHALPKGVKLDREGNVHINVLVSLADVFCGFKKVLRLYGDPVEIVSQDPIDPSLPFVIPGRGLPKNDDDFTDLHVHIIVTYPRHDAMEKMKPIFKTLFKREDVRPPSHPNPILLTTTATP